jgi:hypothetical protein
MPNKNALLVEHQCDCEGAAVVGGCLTSRSVDGQVRSSRCVRQQTWICQKAAFSKQWVDALKNLGDQGRPSRQRRAVTSMDLGHTFVRSPVFLDISR